jgi:hypothetical protein
MTTTAREEPASVLWIADADGALSITEEQATWLG